MADQKLYKELEEYSKNILKLDLFGVADLKSVSDYVRKQGNDHLSTFHYGISIGVHLSDSITDQLLIDDTLETQFEYSYHVYDVINKHLDEMTLKITQKLQKKGYKALPIPTRNNFYLISSNEIFSDPNKLRSAFSHKLTAHLAGLGWIGKSCLLVTKQFGPRVWLATILTDAPLPVGEKMKVQCGSCTSCIDICPVKAFKGRIFKSEEDVLERFDVVKCHQYRRGVLKKKFGFDGCGLCLAICPYGKPKTRKSSK